MCDCAHLPSRTIAVPESFAQCIAIPVLIIFILPVICVLNLCLPIETRLELVRQDAGVSGVVTRRSGCCTWRTPVDRVSAILTEDNEEGSESIPQLFLAHAAGAAKTPISSGSVEGLEAAVIPWITVAVPDGAPKG